MSNEPVKKKFNIETDLEDPQAIFDERERSTKTVSKQKVLKVIKDSFEFAHEQLKGRTPEEQSIIGNFITTIELELKKDLKAL